MSSHGGSSSRSSSVEFLCGADPEGNAQKFHTGKRRGVSGEEVP